MADLDHIFDVDNDVTYTLKDTGARSDIVNINSKLLNEVYPVCFCIAGGWVVQDREYNLTLSEWSNARFNPEYDNDVINVRVSFYDFQTPSPFDDDILIDIDTFIEAQHRQLPVYLDKEKTIRATIGHIRGRTVDFIYVPLERCYYLVGSRIMSEDVVFDTTNTRLSSTNVQDAIAELDDDLALLTASQVGYDHTSSGLVAITVQDAIDEIAAGSGGGTAASIRYDNTVSGLQATDVQDAIDEVVDDLGDKADTSSLATVATSGDYGDLVNTPTLATVATSGDYDDLTNKPTIPAAQVNADWNASSGVAQILNKPTLAQVATTGSALDVSYSGYATGNNVKDAIDDVALDLLDKQDTMIAGSNTTIRDGHIIDVGLRDVKVDGNTRISASDSSPVLLKSGRGIEIDASTSEITFNSTYPDNYREIVNSGSSSTQAISGSWHNDYSWTFPQIGIWLVQVSLTWDQNATGYRMSGINTSVAQPAATWIMRTSANSGNQTTHNLTIFIRVTSTTQNYYLVSLQNSGQALTTYPRVIAMRLAPL